MNASTYNLSGADQKHVRILTRAQIAWRRKHYAKQSEISFADEPLALVAETCAAPSTRVMADQFNFGF